MYKIFYATKSAALALTASIALLASSAALAGPGKPGKNDILDGGNIVDIALAVNDAGNGEFNNLLAAVECFGELTPEDNDIIALLAGKKRHTLFAPVDAAFADLLARLSDIADVEITDPCKIDDEFGAGTLFTVLAYHVVEGRRFSNSLFDPNDTKLIETLAEVDIVSFVDPDDNPILHDVDGQEIGVVEDLININASNGVIHVIDGVLLPIDLPDAD